MSTTELGDQFRDQITELLRAAGYNPISEVLVDHKRIDVFFEQQLFGKTKRYAVEAKNWSKPLNHSDLEGIYGGYASFIATSKIDQLLVISPHEITSAAAKAFVRDTPGISHLSLKQFQESILGFHEYLSTFVHNHEAEGLERYFIAPSSDLHSDLGAFIDEWVASDDKAPIAIIAGYGMGKTSLAKHLTYKYAKRFLSGDPCRVPILVSLGSISREQSLEGLVGSILTGGKPFVLNYNFPLFFHLNSLGRFLVLLDGFDEMKHMMTWADFQSNFDELNRLVTGKAKVILLGRPTVFLSDAERTFVLRGSHALGKTSTRRPGAPVYSQTSLLPFTAEQVRQFINNYLAHHQETGNIDTSADFLERRQQEISAKSQEELISRPVHARMLADIATDANVAISNLSRFDLYDHFVDHLIGRELKKLGRGKLYKANDWRSFACDLAWHLWRTNTNSGTGCRLDDLPDELFLPYCPANEDLQAAKRTLLSGSFLDEKAGGVYFFSHRSFQEFLVAEYIWSTFTTGDAFIDAFLVEVADSLTTEVFDFLIERDDRTFFRALLVALGKCEAPLPIELFSVLKASEALTKISSQLGGPFFSRWAAAILIAHAFDSPSSTGAKALIRELGVVADKSDGKPTVLLAAAYLVMLFAKESKVDFDTIVPTVVRLLFSGADKNLVRISGEVRDRTTGDLQRNVLFDFVSASFDVQRNLVMTLQVGELLDALREAEIFPIAVDYTENDEFSEQYTAPFEVFFAQVPPSQHELIRNFYRGDASAAEGIKS